MHSINKHEGAQLERNRNNLEITLGSPKTESSKFYMFRRVNGEALAYDQMFCTSDCWVDRPGTVLTSFIKNWCG